MTQILTQVLDQLSRLSELPAAEQDRIAAEIMRVLERRVMASEPHAIDTRTFGLGAGTVRIADDFDAPLPDAFWLGSA